MADSSTVLVGLMSAGLVFSANMVAQFVSKRNTDKIARVTDAGSLANVTQKQIEDWQAAVAKDNDRLRAENKSLMESVARLETRTSEQGKAIEVQEAKIAEQNRTIARLEATIGLLSTGQRSGHLERFDERAGDEGRSSPLGE